MTTQADKTGSLAVFESQEIRREWHSGRWFFSVTDMIAALTDSVDPLAYWRKLKERLKQEGNESVTKCHGLKLVARDGKKRLADTADTETMLRLIQSIPSPNAEPFKLWLAQVGSERIEEIKDPELAMNRAKNLYERKGYPKSWIDKRLRGINVRNTLTRDIGRLLLTSQR